MSHLPHLPPSPPHLPQVILRRGHGGGFLPHTPPYPRLPPGIYYIYPGGVWGSWGETPPWSVLGGEKAHLPQLPHISHTGELWEIISASISRAEGVGGVYNKPTTRAHLRVIEPRESHTRNPAKTTSRRFAPSRSLPSSSNGIEKVRGSTPLISTIHKCVQIQGFPRFRSRGRPLG